MKIAVLTANLGKFDNPIRPAAQLLPIGIDFDYHCFTDDDFPPITGLSGRLQYRIPKLFGWEMYPNYDVYIWLDGSMSLLNEGSIKWFMEQLDTHDMALFRHPWRKTIKEEVQHIDQKLKEGNKYIESRYKNGLHVEQYKEIMKDKTFVDDTLFASTAFVYRNTSRVQEALKMWWYYQSRYFTCDQVVLPYVVKKCNLDINVIQENIFKHTYISLVSAHK